MTEPIPQWKYTQQLEARIQELEAEIVQLKNRAFIDAKIPNRILKDPKQIIPWSWEGIAWSNQRGTLHGSIGNPKSFGRLSTEWIDRAKTADYVIYAWDTPIAWLNKELNDVIMPKVFYTKTTTRYQNEVRESYLNFLANN